MRPLDGPQASVNNRLKRGTMDTQRERDLVTERWEEGRKIRKREGGRKEGKKERKGER